MKRNFVVGMFGGLIGAVMLLIVLSATGIVGARSSEVARSDVARANEVSAATPLTSTFTYQGQLKTSSGSPISDTCGFQFGLWDSASGLAQIGLTQTVSSVSVSRGLFTALLNTGNEFGGTAFNGDARWLQIAVRCPDSGSYTAMSTRQALTSLPFALPGLRTFPNATSPNIIGGYSGNFISSTVWGSVIGGGGWGSFPNRVQASFATVGGGVSNIASSQYATVGGGSYNTASGGIATVAGGDHNNASGDHATIGGGRFNFVSGYYATVAGGYTNTASGNRATVGGGAFNTVSGAGAFVGGGGYDGSTISGNQATGNASTIGGGLGNTVSNTYATVGGGDTNTASGQWATVPGGFSNTASGLGSFAAGYDADTNNQHGAFVWSDDSGTPFQATGPQQFLIRANGGMGVNTASPVANTLTVGGSGLRVATDGTTLARVQAGTYTSPGGGIAGVNVFTITFPTAFSTVPKITITPRDNFGSPVNDTFVVTTRSLSTSSVSVNVYRIDVGGGTWLQHLQFDWFAWE